MDGSRATWAPHPQNHPRPRPQSRQATSCYFYLTGKHPPEGGDDSLCRPHSGHHCSKGPLMSFVGVTRRESLFWDGSQWTDSCSWEKILECPGQESRELEGGRAGFWGV